MISQDLKNKLKENSLIIEALKQAKSEDEKKKILDFSEQFLEKVLDLVSIENK